MSTIQLPGDSARILGVIRKGEHRMRSLVSCLPRGLVRSIEGDEEIVLMFLRELWSVIVGEELARNTEPVALNQRMLEVHVPSSLWANQLIGIRTMIIDSINRFWGQHVVDAIKWQVHLSGPSTYGEW